MLVSGKVDVCGYVLAALDSKAFYSGPFAASLLESNKALSCAVPDSLTKDERGLLQEIQSPTTFLPESLYADFPSHLHIDIKPHAQGRGFGKIMISTVLQKLATEGSKGCHLEMHKDNEKALGFYCHLGFEVLQHGPGDNIYLGYRLNTCT